MRTVVRDILPRHPVLCTADTRLREVVQLLIENDCPAVAVVADLESRTPVGLIASPEVIYAGMARRGASQAMGAGDLMTVAAVVVPEELGLDDCLRVLREYETSAVPVVDASGRCRGIVTRAQVSEHLARAGMLKLPEPSGQTPVDAPVDRHNDRPS